MLRMKYDVRDIPHAEFEPIVAQKFLTLHSLAIDECAVFASLIDNVKFAILRRNDGVLAGDSWVRDHQVPSFLEYGEYPYVTADEIKKALRLKAAFSTMLDQMQ